MTTKMDGDRTSFYRTFLCFKIFWPLIPCFGLLVTSPLGFKARVGSLVYARQRHMRFICCTIPADLLTASIEAGRYSPHAHFTQLYRGFTSKMKRGQHIQLSICSYVAEKPCGCLYKLTCCNAKFHSLFKCKLYL